MSQTVQCPACGKTIAVKGIPKHTNGCPKWKEVFPNTPPSEFNFDRHFKRGLYADGVLEGEEYVCCLLCPEEFRMKRLADHLKNIHKVTIAEYGERFPGAPTSALSTLTMKKQTVMERFGVDNVAKDPKVRELIGERNRAGDTDVMEKRGATNLKKYGHENPFGSKVIQERIRESMQEKYGAPSPQQVPEIRERTLRTHEERYGSRYAFTTAGFREKFKKICQAKWGADHPMQTEAGRTLWEEGNIRNFGKRTALLLAYVQKKAYQTNLANHGGKHSQQCPEVLAKAREVWMEKYGVDNPSKSEEVKARIKEVWMGKYGVPFPPQSLWMNRKQSFPNKLEKTVQAMCPAYVVYSGDGSYWIRYKGATKTRNPDFVVLTAAQLADYKAGAKLNGLRTWRIIEVFGDYFHGPLKTGKSNKEHEAEVIEYYAKAGVTCLVLWEGEIKKDPKGAAQRLLAFLEESECTLP